ncbi:hypothetical protein Tco_0092520 [Tanacetum coccineum]
MSTPVSTSSTDSQMHNNIMAAGSKDRPPMLGPERYSQWRSPNEMWIAIKRLQQGESLNVQDVKTNLFWEFGKFTSRDGNPGVIITHGFTNRLNELTRKQLAKFTNASECLISFNTFNQNGQAVSEGAPKPQKINATSSPTKQSASTKHKGQRGRTNQLHLKMSLSLNDSDPLTSSEGQRNAKELHYLQSIQEASTNLPTTILRTSSHSRNKTEDTTTKYSNGQSVQGSWESKT